MVEISGEEANILLYAFDSFFIVDGQGQVMGGPVIGAPTFKQAELQTLRDKLFGGHRHPDEACDDPQCVGNY